MTTSSTLTILALVGAAFSAGCAGARQPYRAPAPAMPDAWSRTAEANADSRGAGDREPLARWWTTFNDPVLTSLVERATQGNLDVRTAVSRVREARASVAATRTNRLPTVDASASGTVSRSSAEAGTGDVSEIYRAGFDASWELDVFGRLRSSRDVASATAQAREADLQDALVTLAGDVATQYISMRALQKRVGIAVANAASQQETYDLTRFRAQAGLTTELDVDQARANLESTRAQIASLENQRVQATHALAVLTGEAPTTLDRELQAAAEIPLAEAGIATGVPAEAIRRRPDVRSAERQLAAQAAQVNVTAADLYPKFTLSGSIGLETLKFASLFVPGATAITGGPSVSWRAFNREQIRQNVVVQQERQTQAAIAYQASVLRALQDVEDALVALAQDQVARTHLTEAAGAAAEAADLSLKLYSAGLRDFRDVLDTQRSLLSLQDQLAASTANVSNDVVQLYKALGGGWVPGAAP
jgi:NodT family efflux transporter outer membrane factor (OMF) lipoprotein